MYSLLLVDDEPSILSGLYHSVDWYDLGIETVYRAGLAMEALDIIHNHHIDLVITDIRMPEMDGVQLAQMIRKQWPYTKIIFLTGHQDFSYAQTAVDLGVFRYILKPVLYDDIKEVTREAIDMLAQELAKTVRIRDMEDKINRLRPVLRERCIVRWLEWGEEQLLESTGEMTEYNIPVKHSDWGFILAIKADTPIKSLQEATVLHLSLRDLAARILFADCRMLDYFSFDNYSILIFLEDCEADILALQRCVIERLEVFQHTISQTLKQTTTIFWAIPVPMYQIHGTYMTLKGQMNRHITLMANSIIGPKMQNGQYPSTELKSLLLQPSLAILIATLIKDDAFIRIKAFFTELEGQNKNSGILMMQIYHEIAGALVTDSLNRGFLLQEWAGDHLDFFESMSSIHTLEQFRETSLTVVGHYIDYALNRNRSQARNLILQIQSTVRNDLTKEITITSLAEQFSYHPNYLSRLFKQQTNLSLQEFIINERITAAKQLLLEGNKIGNVVQKVGYDNTAHFCRMFKKVVGLTPSQYQQKQLNK